QTANLYIGKNLMVACNRCFPRGKPGLSESELQQPDVLFFGKTHVQSGRVTRFQDGMKTMRRSGSKGHHVLDSTRAAMERMELYCAAHPGSPSAALRPRLLHRSQLWIALLGPSVEEGIVGIGPTVE